jgi:ribonuclease P protein component
MKINTLKKRSGFEFANKNAKKISTKAIVLQVFEDFQTELKEIKNKGAAKPLFGFTATKRVGKAVIRNKCKRRLRAVVQNLLQTQPSLFKNNCNYIFIARHETAERDFAALLKDAKFALYNVDKVSEVKKVSEVSKVINLDKKT